MTFRALISVMLVAIACTKSETRTANGGTHADSSAGNVGSVAANGQKLDPSHAGRIPVLEYHVIGGDKNAEYTRTIASFKADLEDVYKRGYRPITIAQMLDK